MPVEGLVIDRRNDWKNLQRGFDLAKQDYNLYPEFHPSSQMCELLVLGEDHRFSRHPGFDPIALVRATWRTCLCGRKEGGSTIAMQLARTLTGQYDRTIPRKIREIVLAVRLTQYDVRDILPRLYLWVAYYGWRMNNFRQACDRLGIDPSSQDLYSAAQLVARIKYPQPRVAAPHHCHRIEQRSQYLIERYNRAQQRKEPSAEVYDETLRNLCNFGCGY